ncbi:MAG: tRNA (uracil-5-)-methyltransferase family protein [Bacteroidetes bacterium]|nr:tRNA (uracil-5-)-methyltransferase family protein [Bacteroidota bacterium]
MVLSKSTTMKRFEELFIDAVRAKSTVRRTPPPGECRTRSGALCPLCFAGVLEYDQEQTIRSRVLKQWWHEAFPDVPLAPLLPSPRGRFYRSLSKRKAFRRGRVLTLGLIDPDAGDAERVLEIPRCAIEPSEHGILYEVIGAWLQRPVASPLHEDLQYVIIKGDARERIVILNVRSIDAPVVRAANALSKAVTASDPNVRGVFLYEDASDGRYYLGTQSSGTPGRLQRLYGAGTLSHKTAGKRFVYPVLAFSQINQSMLDQLVLTVGELLGLPVQGTLFDLYCGYGLFGIALAENVKRVAGMDISPAAIDAAVNIAQHLDVKNARFVRGALTAEALVPVMQRSGENDCVVLDPPRGGTAEGVIEVIAGRRCRGVVHLFCNIDILVQEAQRWMSSGYRFERAVPLDMFPGTATVEIAGLFVPQ